MASVTSSWYEPDLTQSTSDRLSVATVRHAMFLSRDFRSVDDKVHRTSIICI